ncbi:22070_t:CDS:1 [Cetraspora pellucida]|uniref:22070_t:CDS:1 n=1 Tax=Cetraspora pellucida TaxID=1433469 RepID=A0A9N9H803_9GLOM|nr:22070_t:CDS:1 [Cetraspora pellucida]
MSYARDGRKMGYTPVPFQYFGQQQQPTLIYTQVNLPQPLLMNHGPRPQRNDNRCYECRKVGHYKKNCPRLKNQHRRNQHKQTVVVNIVAPPKTNMFSRFLKWGK